MARRKAPDLESEIVPDEIKIETNPVLPAKKKIVESRVVTYDEPAIEEAELEEGYEIEEKPRRKHPTIREERNKLRDKLKQNGVTPASDLRVYISRYVNENETQGGMFADVEDFGKYAITEEALLRGDHMDIARRFGSGRYFFKVYMQNQLVTQFDGRIGALAPIVPQQNGQVVADPNNPGVTIQMPSTQPIDPMKQMRDSLKMLKEFREAMGTIEPAQQNPAPLSPELQLATVLLTDPDIKKKAVKTLLGSSSSDGEKDLLTMAIEHAPVIIETLGSVIQRIMADFREGQNGAAQMVSQNVSAHSIQNESQHQNGQNALIQGVRQGAAFNQSNRQEYSDTTEQPAHQESVSPKDQLLTYLLGFVVNQCAAQSDPGDTVDSVFQWINETDDVHPFLRPALLKTIKDVSELDIESVIAFVRLQPNGETVTSLPHAKTWFESLQAEIKKAYSGGEASGN